ncbi:MAG: transporter substrate-binding domain-containing protein [Victivallaceae bacterium]|nr:transporter substrate-binding domain-containing protein [Victivallaceae bacterium]
MTSGKILIAIGIGCLLSVNPVSARTWQEICHSGKLRVLTNDTARDEISASGLPRRVMPIDREQALLESFARKEKLQLEYVRGRDFPTLFKLLELGQGDLISANLAETPERKTHYLLSTPFGHTREIFFTASDSGLKGNSWKALAGKTAVLLPGTTYVENFRRVAKGKTGLKFRELKTTIPHDELIEKVAGGEIAYSVLNESSLDAWLAYRKGIRKLFPLQSRVPLVFAAKSDAVELIDHLDSFIRELQNGESARKAQKVQRAPEPASHTVSKPAKTDQERVALENDFLDDDCFFTDLDQIRKRGYIRMLTTNDAFGCYLHRGRLMGFEYELANRFGESIDTRVAMVMVSTMDELCQWLMEGKGDFVAANFSLTEERVKKYPGLTFCTPYGGTTQVVVGRKKEKITSVAELKGRRVVVYQGGNCHDSLLALQKSGIPVQIEAVSKNISALAIFRDVSEGKYDLAALDDTFLSIAYAEKIAVKKLFALKAPEKFVWVVRKKNPKLAAEINAFFARENKSAFYNLCYKRYYGAHSRPQKNFSSFVKGMSGISPYDAIFRKYAVRYGFNWYFVAAQSYRESRFDPSRVNEIGAAGLMQVMPETAKELGISNLTDPDNGVHAGTKYMAKLHKRFEDGKISPENQLCFSLASYNAGYGHVLDARKLAAQKGWDPDVWFGNTEKALALLETPAYARRAKYGYCRASETIPYVADIMHQARHYESLGRLQKEKSDQSKKEKDRKK